MIIVIFGNLMKEMLQYSLSGLSKIWDFFSKPQAELQKALDSKKLLRLRPNIVKLSAKPLISAYQ